VKLTHTSRHTSSNTTRARHVPPGLVCAPVWQFILEIDTFSELIGTPPNAGGQIAGEKYYTAFETHAHSVRTVIIDGIRIKGSSA